MHFQRCDKTIYYNVITVLRLRLLKHSSFIITSYRFIRKSHSAYALDQNLLATFSNPLSIKLNFAGGDQTIVQNKKYFACVLLCLLRTFFTY